IAGSLPGQGISAGSADGIGGNAQFNWPYGVASAGSGILYVSDHEENHTVRKLSLTGTNWLVSTLAGLAGQIGVIDGMGASARFNNPTGIAVDSKGNIFVADQDSYTIRKITPTGVVTTFAGMAHSGGDADGTGASARFFVPTGVAVDSTDNIYVCDTGNNAIRKITPTGVVTTFVGLAAGNPQQWYPTGIAVDRQGNIFVADNFNMTIVKVKLDKNVATVAGLAGKGGGNDGIGSNARFYSPEGLAVDPSGALYIADEGDIIRKGVAYNGAPFISTQPQGTNIQAGTNAQFTIAVYGYTSSEITLLKYQWQRKPAASNTWTNLASD